jgi:hypothetical protein
MGFNSAFKGLNLLLLRAGEIHGRGKCKWFLAKRFFEDQNEEY